MNDKKNILIILLLISSFCFSQSLDRKTISKKHEINRSIEPEVRGIEVKNIIYYIENDLQTLKAFEKGKVKWETNVIKILGKPKIGKPEIRALQYNNLTITISYGKHDFAVVNIETGEIKFHGAD
ncbi:hypothetical protein [Flavobacterium chungangense]|uniref:Uncharacterized protein n=1 Tax=Flavobacterium chungangense TaxID=554283 RepID=A0A6V6ZEL1_9FLAO|nr:hypothetical protein [Flavobacterium chungangense]CAD0009874.1 hypothetical protein FLACHUCJ7_04514 [Flavobacterium chungangense]